jgi:flagellar protein FlgJ
MDISALTGLTSSPPSTARLTHADHARAAHLRGSALRNATPAEQRAAVASQFEAIMVRQLLGKTMSSMMGSGDSTAGNVYGDLVTDTLAQSLTAGQGLGLGHMIEQQLTPRGLPAAATGAPAAASTQAPT